MLMCGSHQYISQFSCFAFHSVEHFSQFGVENYADISTHTLMQCYIHNSSCCTIVSLSSKNLYSWLSRQSNMIPELVRFEMKHKLLN